MSASPTLEQYQLKDMQARSGDLYAQTKYEIILDWLKGQRGLKILNAGCGSGELSHLLAAQGHQVTGIEPNAEYVKMAESQAARLGLKNCAFHCSAIENFETHERFDAVIATDVIEHIEDDVAAMKKLVSLARPGAWLVITVPAMQWLFGHHDVMLGHYRRYTTASLARLLEKFARVEHLRYFGFCLIPVCLLYSVLLRKDYPIAPAEEGKPSLASKILPLVMKIEKAIPFPLGTSVLSFSRLSAPGAAAGERP